MLSVPPLWIWSTDHLLWLIKDDQNKDDDQPIAFCWLTHFCLYKNQCLFRIRYLFITLERNKWKKYYKFQLNNMHTWLCKAYELFPFIYLQCFLFQFCGFQSLPIFQIKPSIFLGLIYTLTKKIFKNFQIFLLPSAWNSPKRNSLNLRYLFYFGGNLDRSGVKGTRMDVVWTATNNSEPIPTRGQCRMDDV
jgi:hypothetical protein